VYSLRTKHSADVHAGFCSAAMLLIDGTIGYIVTAAVLLRRMQYRYSYSGFKGTLRIGCKEIFGVSRLGSCVLV
jgi:hypothetical protein